MEVISVRSPRAEDTVGWLTIVAVNQQSALATIDFACTGIVSGDHLEPYVAPALPPDIDRTDASGELDFSMLASVMYGEKGRVLGGPGDFMLADMGQNQGVQPGARFAIYRDVYLSQQVPPVPVGEAVVVSTVADNSLIRLTQTRDAIRMGDRLVARKRVERAAAAAAATTEPRPTAVNAGEDTAPKTTTSAPDKPVRTYMFEDVYFEFDRYTLRPQAASVLDEAVTALQQDPRLRLQIEGHTCNIGTAEYNLALGSRRAQAVRDYLTGRGIPAGRLTTVSYGEERPKYDNSQEETRRQNRRASLVVSLQQ
jgi:peptidoglycan-associated lipoprotein